MAKPAKRKMKREVREVVEWAVRNGWTFDGEIDGAEHWILRYGEQEARLPATPSDFRSLANAKAQIRRIAGIPSDSGPAARYRHESRRERFDLTKARREQQQAEAYGASGEYATGTPDDSGERREQALARLAEHAELRADYEAALAQLREIDPRRNPGKARLVARLVVDLQQKLTSYKP